MRPLALLMPLALTACDLSMTQQDRHAAQSSPTLWPGGPDAAAAPDGIVARDAPLREVALADPPHVTPALLQRGRERYTIYCAPCHGGSGRGDGIVVLRGFPRPPSFEEARLIAAPPAHIVAVETHGIGAMVDFAERIAPADRWAVAAYVKALQRAGAQP